MMFFMFFDFSVAAGSAGARVCVRGNDVRYELMVMVNGYPEAVSPPVFLGGSHSDCVVVKAPGDYSIRYSDECCVDKPVFSVTAVSAGTGAGTGDISSIADNGDGTFTHTAGGVATTIDVGAMMLAAVNANPNAFVTALAQATNLVPVETTAGVEHLGLPA